MSSLISKLQEIQAKDGYISKEEITKISSEFNLSESEIYGVVTFYSNLKLI